MYCHMRTNIDRILYFTFRSVSRLLACAHSRTKNYNSIAKRSANAFSYTLYAIENFIYFEITMSCIEI